MYDHSLRYRVPSLKTKPFPRSQSTREHRQLPDAAVAVLTSHILQAAQAPV